MLRKILMGSFSIFAIFAMAGAVLFYTDSASAQIVGGDSAESAEVQSFRQDRENGRRGRHGVLTREEKAEVAASVLGITVEELSAAKEDGTSKEELAAANGTTVDAIHDAIFDASVAKVNTLVDSGDLTEEEGAAIIEKLELKQLARAIIDRDVLKQAAADAIGVTVAELEAAKEARTMSELLEENGVTRDEVNTAVEAAKNDMIDQALANGDITEEQAEQLREMRSGKGGKGGRGGRGGNRAPAAPDDAANDA